MRRALSSSPSPWRCTPCRNAASVWGTPRAPCSAPGQSGFFVTMLLGQASGGKTFIVDVHDFRLKKGLELGACRAIHNRREDALKVILAETAGAGVDFSSRRSGWR